MLLPFPVCAESQTRLVKLRQAPSVDAATVNSHYVLEDRIGQFDAFASAFTINGDDRRAAHGTW
jgi:hypothetical protein